MNKNWLHLGLLVALAVFIASCGGQQTQGVQDAAQDAQAAARQAQERATGGVNPDLLPPPRERLDDIPDLQGAEFVITDENLQAMADAGVPDNVISQLRGLRGQRFQNAGDFADALRDTIGDAATAQHGRAIMENAIAVQLTNEPHRPGDGRGLMAAESMGDMGDSMFNPVFFDFDKYDIKPEFLDAIRKNAQALRDNPDLRVVVEGHCDERGTTEYNLALGERRANAVRNALIDEGIAADRMTIVSFGEERPVDPGHNEEAWAKNRRSVLSQP
jgi:peptidoglycan-associated lipoprotein